MFDFLEAFDCTEQWLMVGIKFRVYLLYLGVARHV